MGHQQLLLNGSRAVNLQSRPQSSLQTRNPVVFWEDREHLCCISCVLPGKVHCCVFEWCWSQLEKLLQWGFEKLKTENRSENLQHPAWDERQACSSLVGAVNEAGCASAQGEMQWFSPSLHLLSINMRWKLIFFFLSVSHVKSLKSVLFYFSPVVPGRFVTSSANVCFLWWRKRSHSGLWNTAALYMSCL